VVVIFPSKVDVWLFLVLVAAAGAVLVAAGSAFRQASGIALVVPVLVIGIGAVLPLWILASTRYVIRDATLHVQSGPFAWRIPVSSITGITPTNSPLASPALSLERLRVEYGAGRVVLLSPADRQAFIHAIEAAREGLQGSTGPCPVHPIRPAHRLLSG
jgi:membrane protein YdbS with pleckstrin-like domain